MSESKLRSLFNSLASYRVGIALHLKRVPFETRTDNIRAGDHHEAVKI
jgi:glutathione S-transferase